MLQLSTWHPSFSIRFIHATIPHVWTNSVKVVDIYPHPTHQLERLPLISRKHCAIEAAPIVHVYEKYRTQKKARTYVREDYFTLDP